jgi:hypothetical protein
MAQPRLKQFLEKLDAELKKSSEDYRRATTNKKVTTFTYKASTIRKTLKYLIDNAKNFDRSGEAVIKSVSKELSAELGNLTRNLKTSFNALAERSEGIQVIPKRGGIVVILQEFEGRDNFGAIQRAYKTHLDQFYANFLEILGKPIIRSSKSNETGEVNVDTAGKAFNLEHDRKGSNVELFINDKIHATLKDVYGEEASATDISAELQKLNLNSVLRIVKDVGSGEVELFIGSQIRNAIESIKEKKVKKDLETKLKEAVDKLGGIQNLEGSDSLLTGSKKKALKNIMEPFIKQSKKTKNLNVTFEDFNIKESSPEVLKIVAKTTVKSRSRAPLKAKKAIKGSRAQKGVSSMPLAQIVLLLNQRLPEQVAGNMGSPALNYRTGRFASSARVLGVVETPRGFPSIGYTYQRDPYQVFEMGSGRPGWATPERDPRAIIEKSIRELAAEFAIGRFYTRRL